MGWTWKLIREQCTGCGICADVCPERAIMMTREMAYPEAPRSGCDACRICAEQCPFEAIEIASSGTPCDQQALEKALGPTNGP